MKLGILSSGDLGLHVLKKIKNNYVVEFVMTDKNSIFISSFCNKNNIPFFVGNPRNKNTSSFIENKKIDVLISINYLFIIEKDLINLPDIFAFNIHGSLLPKYRGRTPHVWAIINGEKKTGITAHLIDEECDTGDILHQEEIIINPNDTVSDILKLFYKNYPKIILKVLLDIKNDSIERIKQDQKNATSFPKRSPKHGRIDLNLKSLEIYNWVRAQAKPYPGAFMYYNDNQIIIDEVKLIDTTYDKKLVNGFIISLDPILIKVCDGVLNLSKIRKHYNNFKINTIFR